MGCSHALLSRPGSDGGDFLIWGAGVAILLVGERDCVLEDEEGESEGLVRDLDDMDGNDGSAPLEEARVL